MHKTTLFRLMVLRPIWLVSYERSWHFLYDFICLSPKANPSRVNLWNPAGCPPAKRSHRGSNLFSLFNAFRSSKFSHQFRALLEQLYRSPEYRKHIRKEIVKQLKEHHSLYESYVPMRYKRYYKKMKKLGEWGDHVTLQAVADKMLQFSINHGGNTGCSGR